jgi:imidazolonepropionase-like amidohydrolase
LTAAGVNISLATDSLASVTPQKKQTSELDLFEEMRSFARQFPAVSPETILPMVTTHPAKALGHARRLGELSAGAWADLIAVPTHPGDVFEGLVHHHGRVTASLVNGRWALPAQN